MIFPANGVARESKGAGFVRLKRYQNGFARMDTICYEDTFILKTETVNDITAP